MKFPIITVALLLSCFLQVSAQSFEFIENKGQWDSHVKYKGALNAGAFFLQSTGYRVLQYDTATYSKALAVMTAHAESGNSSSSNLRATKAISSDKSDGLVKAHAYDVVFEGANTKGGIVTERPMPGYSNYLLGSDSSKWASHVKGYGALVYKELYPGIDVRYYSENGFLKYDFIVQPNADVESIAMRYDGVDGLKVQDGDLYVQTSVNTVREQYPYSYQLVNGVRQEVKCKYDLKGNTVRFKLSGYDRSKVLIIDPTLIFCSFVGGTEQSWGYTATYDAAGNLYAGGIVFGSGYPTTTGAFQTSFAGGANTTGEQEGYDIGIMKFNPTGAQRVYATYIGGSGNEQPHSLVTDGRGELVLSGRTFDGNTYPVRPAGNRLGARGGWDIIVTRLSADGGSLIGSIVMGGSENDGVNINHKYPVQGSKSLYQNYGDDSRSEVILNGAGEVCIASCTQSANFPVTGGVLQGTKSGEQDALLIKLNSSLSTVVFSTFLGGSSNDAAYVLAIAPGGDFYVAGGTESTNFPGDKTGTIRQSNGGTIDGFIARINSSGTSLIKSTYVGTAGIDQIYGIQFDQFGFVYVGGTSTGSMPVQNAVFSQTGGKQFISKLQADFSAYVYSTVWGTNSSVPNISPTAFLVDKCENVYVSGWGGAISNGANFLSGGTFGLTVTSDAIKAQTDGKDFYFFVLEKNAASQLYGSFFGQQFPATSFVDHVDGGTSRFDRDGVIYQAVCANCGGGQYPVTPGVVGSVNNTGSCNEAVIKISFDLSGIRGGVKASIEGRDGDTTGCVPLTVSFRDTIGIGKTYEWLFGDGSASETTTTPNVSHTYTAIGTYQVRMITVDSTKCYPRDTTYTHIIVRADRAVLLASAAKQPPCESNTYVFTNQSTAPAAKPFENNSFLWIFGDNSANVVAGANSVTHTYPGPGTYNVKLVLTDTNYCNAPDTFAFTLRVNPNVIARVETPAAGCAPYNAVFNNVSLAGTDFMWYFDDGTTSTEVSPTKLYIEPGTYTIKLVANDPSTCNLIDSTTITIVVSGKPTAAFVFSPNPPEENIITTFTNQTIGAAIRYNWTFGDGDTLQTIRRDTLVRHQYRQTNTYTACLAATNQYNCTDTVCQEISIIINPMLDVVSAFTPNNDGVNDRAVVIGYGIEQMVFRIYNRWGQKVFESNDVRLGWDGIFKGKAQPMDAYGYTLEARFYGGESIKKSGSITLIR